MDTDVLIAGAGPAGLVLGIELARRGIAFPADRAADCTAASVPRKGNSARTLEIYEDIGACLDILKSAARIHPCAR